MIRIMEVCGTHTTSIFRHGLREALPGNIKLISGPGCPVCVTSQGEIDQAVKLSESKDVIVATYGDMVRVPGSSGSLADRRAQGADVRVVLSASQCIDLARENPKKQVVFLAVGFETTAPATAATVLQAHREGIDNLSILCFHKKVPPALRTLAEQSWSIDGLLLPGNVAVILGHEPFRFLPEERGIPSVIGGFSPGEILSALGELLRQIKAGSPKLTSCYSSVVRPEGNPIAIDLMRKVFKSGTALWRGLGPIEDSGMVLREEFLSMDGSIRFSLKTEETPDPEGCICGRVLSGLSEPKDCPLFGGICTPVTPVGPCMVSGEGTCSAWFRYGRKELIRWKS
ncbi:hydrogenase formation protein HypD [Dethiosulfovibrio salsuginis]|uniref:Hydrogenase expression/formation protein HypD n=1 Tax=Dethiosulfovibrio salsuginis TaxID=561720 RepID=A0A1X7J1J5_9BACT|nr:hydrogenase formation protein HypD [Dethiosulfovibrio salsuginis]SMG21019.1 hydrogenase expression/formation protein HypD [Dethiosulfovibrio salsuginis]